VTLFVATITMHGGKQLRGRQTAVAEALLKIFVRDLPEIIAGQGGETLSGFTVAELDVRSQRYQIPGKAPNFTVELRPDEQATFMRGLQAEDAKSIATAFVQYVAQAVYTLSSFCGEAELEHVRITTWLPNPSGVHLNISTGNFVQAWGGLFRTGESMNIGSASPA